MKFRAINAIIILISFLASFFISGPVEAQTYTEYEYYNSGDDASAAVYSSTWQGQTFTTSAAHTINAVRLKMYKAGTAGDITVSIRACNAGTGLPEGSDLTTGSYDATILVTATTGSYREIALTEYTLAANTKYAILVQGTANDSSNCAYWRYDSTASSYTGGSYITSTDDGVTWTANTSRDYMFEVYGEASLEVIGAQVYNEYGEDGDGWLFVVNYICEQTPDTSLYGVENYYQLQLLDGSTVKAQVPLQQWGQRPGSIFINGDDAAALEWGHDYIIRLYGTYGSNPSDSYTLTSADWIGNAYSQLDAWCITLAQTMETRDSEEYLTESENGYVLNTLGGSLFTIGIPYLPETRPGIFQYVLSTLEYTEEDWTNAYPDSLDPWESWMGTEVTAIFNSMGDFMGGISGQWALGLCCFLVYVVIAGAGVFKGHAADGIILGAPIILLSMNWLIIPMALVATFIMLAVFKWLKAEWPERT